MTTQQEVARRDTSLYTFMAAAHRLRACIAQRLAQVGLSQAEYALLTRLNAGEWRGTGELDAEVAEQLASKGFIRRVAVEANRHGVVRITEAGRGKLDDAIWQIELVSASFAASFTGAQRTELGRLLAKMG